MADVRLVTDANVWHPVAWVQIYPGFADFFRVAFSPAAFGPHQMGTELPWTHECAAHQGMLGPNNEEGHTREPNEWKVEINAEPVMLNRRK